MASTTQNLRKSEAKIQQEIFTYHWNNYPEERKLLFMVHNNPFNKVDGARLKSQGMVAGAPDMIYLDPRDHEPVFLEIKTDRGRQSDAQKEFQSVASAHGFGCYYIIRSLEEAKEVVGWTR